MPFVVAMLPHLLSLALLLSLVAVSFAHPLLPPVDALGLELRRLNSPSNGDTLPPVDPLALVGPRQPADPEPSPLFDDVVFTFSPEPSLDSTPDPDFILPSPEFFAGSSSAFPRPTSSPRANAAELSMAEDGRASPSPPPQMSGSPTPTASGASDVSTGTSGTPTTGPDSGVGGSDGGGGAGGVDGGRPPEGAVLDVGPRTTCFPGGVSVVVKGKGQARMDEVEIGDWVLVGEGRFDRVFGFTHRISSGRRRFVRLVTAGGREVRATSGHFVYVQEGVKRAGDVAVGDFVPTGDGEEERVVQVEEVLDDGLYNPQTLSGDVVVGGLRVTTYTEAIIPNAAHALLAPVRAAYRAFGVSSDVLEEGWDGLPRLLRPVNWA